VVSSSRSVSHGAGRALNGKLTMYLGLHVKGSRRESTSTVHERAKSKPEGAKGGLEGTKLHTPNHAKAGNNHSVNDISFMPWTYWR
jgi:hypothetical protein